MDASAGQEYTTKFFDRMEAGSQRSARVIAPLVMELVSPRSVVDVGSGEGAWLSAFRELGIEDVLGVDGPHVDPARLRIPRSCFLALNLEEPFRLPRRYDLALSLEVAEHLPEASAAAFVESLTRLAPLVLFSAAVPFQGGTRHVNEQWQDYWVALFARCSYRAIDCIRGRVWSNLEVAPWYAQNALLYAAEEALQQSAVLREAFERTDARRFSVVHPLLMARMSTVHAKKMVPLTQVLGWRLKSLLRKDYRLDPRYGAGKEFRGEPAPDPR